ncbi:MAG TPA: 4-alpha-glucanotransferase, partial [Gemmatimonadaceae bacterium]|nr:4-alpha-glucanotransferase [Gemmatimonadaceae bacterium]
RWGVFAPMYGLASAASGQAGDLASMAELFDALAARGGSYVATLPILAQFLDEPCAFSPYSPASRLWWNELYLDLTALAADVQRPAGSASFRPGSLVRPDAPPIVNGTLIDYRACYAQRRRQLDSLVVPLLAARGLEIDAWARTAGAYDYAAFRALGEHARTGWRSWTGAQPDFIATRESAIAAGCDAARVDAHVVAQWAMQRQLDALQGGKVQLYLDLPVGVNTDAYEVWRWREQFLLDASAGAPPDPLFLGGQDWGLPPLSPIASRREHHRYFIACIRHHVRNAGMLRVDHVMGLFRLYCVPHGRPATDGVYLRYPHEELLAILALESARAKCALVGEDLGTVPDGVRPAMEQHGMFRIHVGQWYLPSKLGGKIGASPAECVAGLNTHDTPTFAGWWTGADIADKRDLALIDSAQEAQELAERAVAREAMLELSANVPGLAGGVEGAMVAATADLAAGPAEIVLVALDDLTLDPVPHNVPGTTSQRPNWQRRIAQWRDVLDPLRAPSAAAAAIAAVVKARPSTK